MRLLFPAMDVRREFNRLGLEARFRAGEFVGEVIVSKPSSVPEGDWRFGANQDVANWRDMPKAALRRWGAANFYLEA